MTANDFRRLALSLPDAKEGAHMGHADFRVGGKIFATLAYPEAGWGALMLTPEEQEFFVGAEPKMFAPVKGGWGKRGATNVRLKAARTGPVRAALTAAWRKRAPKRSTRSTKPA